MYVCVCVCVPQLGYTPLHAACEGGHVAAVVALLFAGADKGARAQVGAGCLCRPRARAAWGRVYQVALAPQPLTHKMVHAICIK